MTLDQEAAFGKREWFLVTAKVLWMNYLGGGLSAVFYHLLTDMPKYKVGERIVQAKIGITLPIEWEEVEELSDTDRGTNGYGSTGQK